MGLEGGRDRTTSGMVLSGSVTEPEYGEPDVVQGLRSARGNSSFEKHWPEGTPEPPTTDRV